MTKKISFYGASGTGHVFDQVDADSTWVNRSGVAVFAAPDAYGWRVIRVVELTGRDHDVRPIWALHDAERFGANAVFVTSHLDRDERCRTVDDLEVGLNPVLGQLSSRFALAA